MDFEFRGGGGGAQLEWSDKADTSSIVQVRPCRRKLRERFVRNFTRRYTRRLLLASASATTLFLIRCVALLGDPSKQPEKLA